MWDIKTVTKHNLQSLKLNFHLNHVGYKGNNLNMTKHIRLIFHLNHVGYKAKYVSCINPLAMAFIWTMWDIKFWASLLIATSVRSFIWTMWDIKVLVMKLSISPDFFHLNHVGYKGWIFGCRSFLGCFSFHLNHVGYKVMRDLKY